MKNIRIFYLKFFPFLVAKFSIYLNRSVSVMHISTLTQSKYVSQSIMIKPRYFKILGINSYHRYFSEKKNVSFVDKSAVLNTENVVQNHCIPNRLTYLH